MKQRVTSLRKKDVYLNVVKEKKYEQREKVREREKWKVKSAAEQA